MGNLVENYGWDAFGEEGPESCTYIAPQVVKILNGLGVRRVCDVGSGNGALVKTLQGEGYYAAGVEYDKEGIEIAEKINPDTNFYNLGVEDSPKEMLSREGGHFDVVVSTEVVEHLFSPHCLPLFARKLLIPGGYLVISTPYHGYLKNLALSFCNKWDTHIDPLWHGGHIKFWSPKTLTLLLESNGFKVCKFYGVGRFPFFWKSMILVARAT